MSEVQVVNNTIYQQNAHLKSKGDHKNGVHKQKHTGGQQNTDSTQNEGDERISSPNLKSAEKILPKKNESEKLHTIRKCIRKGSRVCYTDMENITVLRKIPEKDTSRSSAKDNQEGEVFEKIDSYRSGESLFKTFTFEQTRGIDDPETVKCIEFWKSVMKKNLAPIKCTLIEGNNKSVEKKKEKSSISSKEKKSENGKSDSKKEKVDFTGDGAKIWSEALKEIRRRKLDQLKLYVRERCQYCTDPFTKDLKDQWGVQDLPEQQAEIISLNSWQPKPKQMDLIDSFSKSNLRKRFSYKQKKVSTAQTIETRMNERPASDQVQKEHSNNSQSKTKIVVPGEDVNVADSKQASYDKQDPSKRPASILKTSSKPAEKQRNSAASDTSRRVTGAQMSSVEVQAPNIKCPCESDTCVCPHKAAARNSRTSFVEIARKNMLNQDNSIEKFFPSPGEPCICERFKPQPWLKLSCYNGPCPAKSPKIKVVESSSEFNLPSILENSEDICVCTKKLDVVCPSANCKNKMSQGSLVEGFPHVKGDDEDFCVCSTEFEAPCTSDVCPIRAPKEISTTCICGNTLPWSKATCQSWTCKYHRIIKRKIVDDEDQRKFRGHRPIKKFTSTCMCQDGLAWNDVECDCELCTGRSKQSSILKVKDRKRSSALKTVKSKSSSRDIVFGKRKKSREKPISNPSLERLNKEKERVKPKIKTADKSNGCVCSDAPPWKIVTCQKRALQTKDCSERSKTNLSLISPSADRVSTANEEECVCRDAYIEPTCKVYKCKNKEISFEYPPPCICPKDKDESKHEHFRCVSETCTMKKIDKTCLCRFQPDAPCDAKTCVANPQASKKLVQSKKPLRHDAKCICKVRGLPTTQEVTCVAPECPFQKKHPKPTKKKAPQLFVPPPYEHKSSKEEIVNTCICTSKDNSKRITCHSLSCRTQNSSFKSRHSNDPTMDYNDEDDSEQEICICKDEQTTDIDKDEEVICNHNQCPKMSVDEDGAVMNDKCVCANLDQTCNEPSCPSADNKVHDKICSDLSPKEDRPYCYICGHYDCASANKKTVYTKVCKELYTDIEERN